MDKQIFGKTVPEIRALKNKAETEIYEILKRLQREINLEVDKIDKKTAGGGNLDTWYSMDIKLKSPI